MHCCFGATACMLCRRTYALLWHILYRIFYHREKLCSSPFSRQMWENSIFLHILTQGISAFPPILFPFLCSFSNARTLPLFCHPPPPRSYPNCYWTSCAKWAIYVCSSALQSGEKIRLRGANGAKYCKMFCFFVQKCPCYYHNFTHCANKPRALTHFL